MGRDFESMAFLRNSALAGFQKQARIRDRWLLEFVRFSLMRVGFPYIPYPPDSFVFSLLLWLFGYLRADRVREILYTHQPIAFEKKKRSLKSIGYQITWIRHGACITFFKALLRRRRLSR
jgi:hypothetical protein